MCKYIDLSKIVEGLPGYIIERLNPSNHNHHQEIKNELPIYSAVELYQANFGFWIADLSKQDPYYITPVILWLLMIVQFRLNPSAGDQMQAKIMMWVMPIMFTAMMIFLPSGLVVYILVNTVLGIMQQWYFYRAQGITSLKA